MPTAISSISAASITRSRSAASASSSGEIEAALGALAAVREAVVVAREDMSGDQRLVAYSWPGVAAPAAAGCASLLADAAGVHGPAAFVALDALPLTPNGKIDRRRAAGAARAAGVRPARR